MPFANHGIDKLTQTSETRQVKRAQTVVTARFTIRAFVTFSGCQKLNPSKLSRESM